MSLEDIKSALNKKFKSELLQSGEDAGVSSKYGRIPFTSPRLNYLTRGGIPRGNATELSGPENSGKSSILADLTKQAQKLGLQCSITDTENKMNLDWWKYLGVDIDQLLVCKPTNVSGEDILQLQMDMIREGVMFAGLDSVASLVPGSVLAGQMDDKTWCGSSGILSTFSQKVSGTGLLKSGACLVGINQVRDKVSSMHGGLQTPGGHFWRHLCICRLQISHGKPFDANYTEMPLNTKEITQGYWMEANLIKNQFSKNDRKLNFATFNYDIGFDILEDLIDVAIDLEVIHRSGAWYRFVSKDSGEILCADGEELKFQGKSKVREYLKTTSRIARWVESQVNLYITEI